MNISDYEIKRGKDKTSPSGIIIFFCVLGFLLCIPLLFYILVYLPSPPLDLHKQINLLAFILIFILQFLGLIGCWKMKKWGTYLYALGTLIEIVLGYLLEGSPGMQRYGILAIFITGGLLYFNLNAVNKSTDKAPPLGTQHPRPWIVTILCIFGGVYRIPLLCLILIYLLAKELTFEGQRDLLVFIFIVCTEFSGIIGYWKMQKWAIYIYSLGSAVGIIYNYLSGWSSPIYQYLILVLFIGIGFIFYKRMR